MPKIYALLAGINAYPPGVRQLAGCLNDIDNFHGYLKERFDKSDLAVEVLKDGDATRGNITSQFRTHLSKAGPDDVAVFHYCGHGALSTAARAFHEFSNDGKDEGLVCFDSRLPGGFDLADKELAVLIAELAANDPHIAIILDCCHSGSGTRDADDFRGLAVRTITGVFPERPLESYIDGHYAKLQQRGESLFIPASRHILMAACDSNQTAKETPTRSGVFTSTLVEVLGKSVSDLAYSDLFVRCRAAVRTRADNQDPQFEPIGNFNAFGGFLGGKASIGRGFYSAYVGHFEVSPAACAKPVWNVDCGAIHGLPTDADKPVSLALYAEDDQTRLVGLATVSKVGAQQSVLALDFAGDPAARYRAAITSLPVPPLPVWFDGSAADMALAVAALKDDGAVNMILTESAEGTRYALSQEDGALYLKQRDLNLLIQGVRLGDGGLSAAVDALRAALKQVAKWERTLELKNPATTLDTTAIDFVFAQTSADGHTVSRPAGDIVLDYVKAQDGWPKLRGKLQVRNGSGQPLHAALLYFSENYGIYVVGNLVVEPTTDYVTLWGADPKDFFFLDDDRNASLERFKLLVSTDKIDDFLFTEPGFDLRNPLIATRGIGTIQADAPKIVTDDWFTRDCRFQIVRRLQAVGPADATLAGGQIVVKGHPALTGNLSLSASSSSTRGVEGGSDFYRAFERQGLSLLNFAGTRGDDQSVLELTDLQNTAGLKDQPLDIQLHVPVRDGETIIPVLFDGEHALLAGNTYVGDDGATRIVIDRIPDGSDGQRSLAGALKLYFFKTYLNESDVNQLRWVEYKTDGSFIRRKDDVASKVAAARNILLLVHGIIGDTEDIAAGVQALGLDKSFDLVLTYDYESLSTPIAETARQLKTALNAAGLDAAADKHLTLLVHSMGGLVSRWFIEREGGNGLVDHLVMCGTPNNGSPFGKIEDARKILAALTTLAMNAIPPVIPCATGALFLLNRSKKLTPALEQMNPQSDFIKSLNQSADPGVPYTILAGDISKYTEPTDRLFPKLLTKVGQSMAFQELFAEKANDIAVGVDSILAVGASGVRAPPPERLNVDCYHLNYFASQAGRDALRSVNWSR